MRMKDNKFFSFFDPVLKYIDTGKFFREPFRWLYAILGDPQPANTHRTAGNGH